MCDLREKDIIKFVNAERKKLSYPFEISIRVFRPDERFTEIIRIHRDYRMIIISQDRLDLGTDNEIKAVLRHEISHFIQPEGISPYKQEFFCDKHAVKMGSNPNDLISYLYKCARLSFDPEGIRLGEKHPSIKQREINLGLC